MLGFFKNIKAFWDKDPFATFCFLSITIILVVSIIQYFKNQTGTWSKWFFIPKNNDDYISSVNNKKDTSSRGELECRRVLEQLFNKPFIKARPDFLNNPVTGGNFNLDLDCCNPELKLLQELQLFLYLDICKIYK